MMRVLRRIPAFMAALMVVAIGVAGSAAFRTAATATQATLGSVMLGKNEVPKAGDPHASGSTVIVLNSRTGLVCYSIMATGFGAPLTAAHIHKGEVGVAGPVVIPLPLTGNGNNFGGCTTADKKLIQAIINDPDAYYTNVHNADFPGGVMRGQLGPLVP